jgi:hypothetical protein
VKGGVFVRSRDYNHRLLAFFSFENPLIIN